MEQNRAQEYDSVGIKRTTKLPFQIERWNGAFLSKWLSENWLFGKKITLDPYLKVQVKINSLWIINYDPPEATTQNYCKKTWENIL